VVSDSLEAARSEELLAIHRHTLTIGEDALTGTDDAGRGPESVDEGGEHRRMQPGGSEVRTLEGSSNGGQIDAIGASPSHQRHRQRGIGTGVGVEGDDPVTARRVDPLGQRPGLTRPAGWAVDSGEHPGSTGARYLGGGIVGLVVHDDDLEYAGCTLESIEAGPESGFFVARRNNHRDVHRQGFLDVVAFEWRISTSGAQQPLGDDRGGGRPQTPPDPATETAGAPHQVSLATRSATIRALDNTSGSPPPGWLDPPTR